MRWSSEREIEREPEIHSAQTLKGTRPLEAATEQFSLMLMLKRELGLTLSLNEGCSVTAPDSVNASLVQDLEKISFSHIDEPLHEHACWSAMRRNDSAKELCIS